MLVEALATKVQSMAMLATETRPIVTGRAAMLATEVWAMVVLATEILETETRATEMGAMVYECVIIYLSSRTPARLDHGGSWFSFSYIALSRPGPAVKVGLPGLLRAAGGGAHAGNGGAGNAEAGNGDAGNGDAADQQELQQ